MAQSSISRLFQTLSESVSRRLATSGPNRPQSFDDTLPVRTNYMKMLLQLDRIPTIHNILASAFTWLLLAGYLVFPGTFTSLRNSETLKQGTSGTKADRLVMRTVQNVPLLWLAGICCLCGAGGISWLWWTWQNNFIWLINRLFLPSLLNAVLGLLNTLINVFTAQGGLWSVTAIVTAAVAGTCMIVTLVLFILYAWFLDIIKKDHSAVCKTKESSKGRHWA